MAEQGFDVGDWVAIRGYEEDPGRIVSIGPGGVCVDWYNGERSTFAWQTPTGMALIKVEPLTPRTRETEVVQEWLDG